MVNYAQTSHDDISMKDAFEHCLHKIEHEDSWVKRTIMSQIEILANMEGGRLSQISGKEYDINAVTEITAPEKGYFGAVQLMAKGVKAEIKFNQIVTRIDYSNAVVKVHTKDQVYLARKIISSLPLGVLKSNTV